VCQKFKEATEGDADRTMALNGLNGDWMMIRMSDFAAFTYSTEYGRAEARRANEEFAEENGDPSEAWKKGGR
jgi:catalase (peroxidase I)